MPNTPSSPQPPAYAYRAPHTPASHAAQCYYRTGKLRALDGHWVDPAPVGMGNRPGATVFRFDADECAEITLHNADAHVRVIFDRPALLALRDALNDALIDIDAAAAAEQRRQSLAEIREELDEAEANGSAPGCYYSHPDVHYCPTPEAAAARAEELQAAGCTEYIVLVDPQACAAATDAAATPTEQVPA